MQWVHPQNRRWYSAEISQDLFDTVGVLARWGGAGRRGGKTAFWATASRADADQLLKAIGARRRRHGYEQTSP